MKKTILSIILSVTFFCASANAFTFERQRYNNEALIFTAATAGLFHAFQKGNNHLTKTETFFLTLALTSVAAAVKLNEQYPTREEYHKHTRAIATGMAVGFLIPLVNF